MGIKKGKSNTRKTPPDPIPEMDMATRLKELEEKAVLLEIEKHTLIEKAFVSGRPMDMLRASNELAKVNKQGNGNRQTYTFDPFTTATNLGYKNSPTNITDSFLRGMARTPFIRGVIDTRQNQLSNFSRPTMDMSKPGWTIQRKPDMFNTGKVTKLTDSDKKVISGMVEFILNCGQKDENKYSMFTRPTFESFLRETARDSLTLDNLVFENVENRRGELHSFVAVDAATVKYTDETQFLDENGFVKKEYDQYGQYPMYAQIYNQRIVSTFYPWQMCMGIRNKSTDITQNGYGVSELEDLVKIVTWMLFGDAYNGKFFSQGAAPKGILKVSGAVNQDKLNEFRMYWQQMVSGVQNAWRTPVLESDKIEWIDLQKSNQDMQFSNWSEYLIRIVCAVFKIDSAEMGFMFKGAGGKGGETNTSHKQRTDYSKDKGLMPIMKFYEEIINRYIVGRLSTEFEFKWTGLEMDDEEAIVNLNVKKLAGWMTLNEMRALQNPPLPPVEGGDIVLNSTFITAKQMQMSGNPQSNEALDNMNRDEEDNSNPFDIESSMDENANPFDKANPFSELNDWIELGMPETMVKIQK